MIRRLAPPLLGAAIAAGCATVRYDAPALPPREAAPAYYAPALEKEYRLQAGDTLAIRSYFDSQLNQEVVVRPDGRITALLIGELAVAGLTPEEVARQLIQPYQRLVGDTDLTVAVKHTAGMSVYLSGEVRAASLLQLDGSLTLLQAVARAGGFLPSANTSNVLLIRDQADAGLGVSKIDVEKVLRNEAPDVFLRRRDVVFVPKTEIAQTGQFVEQYVNAIVPRFIQLQFGWLRTRVTNRNPAAVEVIQ
jgi:polysaccharide biosynthesis/export protein